LTDRWLDEEDSGAFFQLRVNHSGGRAWDETDPWLTREKLAGLGFDVENIEQRVEAGRSWGEPARNVFIALEFEGPTWHASVKRLEETYIEASRRFAEGAGGDEEQVAVARSNWERAKTDESRLFIIDADLDPEVLRARYPDRFQVAIAPAEVSVYPSYRREVRQRITGVVSGPLVSGIHVPKHFADQLRAAGGSHADSREKMSRLQYLLAGSRRHIGYRVKLRYGGSYEPWVEAVEAISKDQGGADGG
jgi:hypothetical protein